MHLRGRPRLQHRNEGLRLSLEIIALRPAIT